MTESDAHKMQQIRRTRQAGHAYFTAQSAVYRKFVEL
jgi:hypothetical protein